MQETILSSERPDAILNIIDGTNLERNLYLTTQLTELGIPVVVAINMMDLVKKNGDSRSTLMSFQGSLVVRLSKFRLLRAQALRKLPRLQSKPAELSKDNSHAQRSNGVVEHAIAHIEEAAVHNMPEEQQRWYAIKMFERDDKVIEKLDIPDSAVMAHIDEDIKNV